MTSTLYDRLFISYWCIDFILCSIQKNVIVFTPQWICICCSFFSWTDWHSLIFDTYCWSFPRSNLYHCICSASMDEPHLCEDIQDWLFKKLMFKVPAKHIKPSFSVWLSLTHKHKHGSVHLSSFLTNLILK